MWWGMGEGASSRYWELPSTQLWHLKSLFPVRWPLLGLWRLVVIKCQKWRGVGDFCPIVSHFANRVTTLSSLAAPSGGLGSHGPPPLPCCPVFWTWPQSGLQWGQGGGWACLSFGAPKPTSRVAQRLEARPAAYNAMRDQVHPGYS